MTMGDTVVKSVPSIRGRIEGKDCSFEIRIKSSMSALNDGISLYKLSSEADVLGALASETEGDLGWHGVNWLI